MMSTRPSMERKDDTIRLGEREMGLEAIETYLTLLISERLRRLAVEGWEADGATDVGSLQRQGRLVWHEHESLWSGKRTYTLTSVSIRVKRISTAGRRREIRDEEAGISRVHA